MEVHMKQVKGLAAVPGSQDVHDEVPNLDITLGLPQKFTPENLPEVFSKLAAAVPDTVGHDQREQLEERRVTRGVMRIIGAIRNSAPESPWGRGSQLGEGGERLEKAHNKAGGKQKIPRLTSSNL